MAKLNVDHTFIVHVSEGAEDREKSVKEEMKRHNIPYEFMLRGDLKEITSVIHQKYFTGDMLAEITPAISCAMKHIYILEEIVKRGLSRVLILEDDIFLDKNFVSICNKALEETSLDSEIPVNYFLALENNKKFVPKKDEVKGKYLYKENKVRYGGAYVLTKETAKVILEDIYENKCHSFIDRTYSILCQKDLFNIYWIHPTIAEQGSHNGKFKSLLDDKSNGLLQKVNWRIQTIFKSKIRRRFKKH
jgi:glycosyl transferase, family 25